MTCCEEEHEKRGERVIDWYCTIAALTRCLRRISWLCKWKPGSSLFSGQIRREYSLYIYT